MNYRITLNELKNVTLLQFPPAVAGYRETKFSGTNPFL